jgi:hypothetical protein
VYCASHDGVPPSAFARGTTLGDAFTLLSTNVDLKGRAFASTIESSSGAPIWARRLAHRPRLDVT